MSKQTDKLNSFLQHLKDSANEMLDIISDNGDYEERFNVEIAINGKSIVIPLCADTYSRLENFIEEEIKEELEMGVE